MSLRYDEHNAHHSFKKTNPEMPIRCKFLTVLVTKQGHSVFILNRYEVSKKVL